MHAWSERGQEAWLDAWTELKDGQFAYRVLSERGSDTVRSRAGDCSKRARSSINRSGTRIRPTSPGRTSSLVTSNSDADGSQLITNRAAPERRAPRRRADGPDPDGRDLHSRRGRLAKNPSFWTSLAVASGLRHARACACRPRSWLLRGRRQQLRLVQLDSGCRKRKLFATALCWPTNSPAWFLPRALPDAPACRDENSSNAF